MWRRWEGPHIVVLDQECKHDGDVMLLFLSPQGKKEEEIEEWDILVTEICQAINSKQLVPTLRTQYMRTGTSEEPGSALVSCPLPHRFLSPTY